eukprot:888866-Rhodomonas_salina.1
MSGTNVAQSHALAIRCPVLTERSYVRLRACCEMCGGVRYKHNVWYHASGIAGAYGTTRADALVRIAEILATIVPEGAALRYLPTSLLRHVRYSHSLTPPTLTRYRPMRLRRDVRY